MAYFYEFELILAGIILLTTMAFIGLRIWWKRKAESKEADFTENETFDQNPSD